MLLFPRRGVRYVKDEHGTPYPHLLGCVNIPCLIHRHPSQRSEAPNGVTMSDVNELLIQPLQKFSKDSMHLIKKCTKPDRKG